MYRIYFDGNEVVDNVDYRVGLWLEASKQDLALIPSGPQEGLHVIIYTLASWEMQATLKFDAEIREWTARIIPGTTVDCP
jgi:hypothetical protein